MRAIASRTSGVVSHSTVHQTLSGKRIPRWGALELIVEALGGDPGEFHALWKDLRMQARKVPEGGTSRTAQAASYRFRFDLTQSAPHAEDVLTLERARQIKNADGPLAAAQYLEKRIGKSWRSPLMATYLPLLEEAGQESKVAQIVPHLRGIEMHSAEASAAVAEIFDDLEELAEAVRHGKAALRRDPNNSRYAWLVGSYLATLDLLDESHLHYELAHRLNPADSDFAESYINSLLARSEFVEAEEVARDCWGDENIRVYVGIALALQGSFIEAEAVLTSISKLYSDGVRALAQVLVALDKGEEALSLLVDHMEKFPDDLKSGALYAELLRDAGAMDALSEALRRLEAGVVREEERTAALMAKIQAARRGH
ncbi:tetratricopeptide repeat protein [Streptomyces coeruleorubidus]|uniref:tetratricopeptide repeat protein n=1 Tax=Streptomyces coeruleorubidus TaxID=116188 RepID=UPI00381A7CCB